MTRVFVLGFNFVLLTGLIWSCPMLAQTTVVPNASFEDGGEGPEGWTLSGGQGTWIEGGPDGARAVSVTGTGASGDNNYWRSSGVVFEPDSVYRLRFRAVRLDGSGGSPTTGPIFCNRDLYEITDEWTEYTSVFATPTDLFPFESWVRFGQWQVSGTVAYDDIELARAQPAYRVRGRLVLGEGERVMGREYTFDAPFKGQSANHARPLESFQATFNTHRWVFGANSEVVYHHSVGSSKQVSAALDVTIGHYTGGELLVEGRIEGQTWRTLGSLNRLGTLSVDLPSDFLPADDVWVRLSSRAGRKLGDNSDPGSFQIYAYSYRATLASDPGDMNGGTRFVATTSADARLEVTVRSFGDVLPGGDNVVVARVNNTSGEKLPVRPALRLTSPMGETSEYAFDTTLHPGEQEIRLAYEIPSSGTLHAVLSLGPTISYAAETTFVVPGLYEISYGSLLPASSDKVALWWASSGWKVARDRPSPTNRSAALRIQTARNEVEAAQLVLCPARGLTGFTAQAGPLTGPDGAVIPADRIEVLRVGYVPVSIPTDRVGVAAPWPDPLPPFQGPANLEAGKQQPLWVRVKAPRDTRPGVYKGAIQLSAKGYTAEAPLEVEVFGFELPDRMTCVTAFGFSPANVFRYHNLSDEMHKRAVLDKYLATLSAHHISPYNPAPLDPFTINWTALTPEFDWTAWDAAMTRAIDEYHFNSFQLPIQGLGGGTFHSRQEPNLLGHTEDQPEYKTAFDAQCKAIEAHLSEKGWLD
ncbi:MAG: hypothetical protein GWP08_14960, partial [Nitrospiraceae bacterium]|nr:hypothetical protein [Nitrospiraceae bacterium]